MIVEEMYGFSALRFFRKKGFIWSKVTAFMFEVCGFLWVSRHYEFFRKKTDFSQIGFSVSSWGKTVFKFYGYPFGILLCIFKNLGF